MTTADKPMPAPDAAAVMIAAFGGSGGDRAAGGVSGGEEENPVEPIFMKPEYDDYAHPVAALQAILDGPRVGEVEGVLFDFRHEKLPSAEVWHAPGAARPFGIVFPWDRALWDGDAEAAARYVSNGQNELGWMVTQVHAGDCVSVGRLERFYRTAGKPPYADDHDTHSLAAYLIVTRPDGATETIEDSIQFNARDAMGPASPHFYAGDDGLDEWVGDFRVSLDKVARRLERLRCADALKGRGSKWVNLACDAFEAFVPPWSDDELFPRSPAELAYLLDMAVTVGYAVAMAERAPVVDAAATRTRPATRARRAMADPVREAAKADILANPKTTQTACARRVALHLERDQRSMEKLIAPMFEWVTLPGGAKEKRPRRLYTNPRQIDGWPGLPSV